MKDIRVLLSERTLDVGSVFTFAGEAFQVTEADPVVADGVVYVPVERVVQGSVTEDEDGLKLVTESFILLDALDLVGCPYMKVEKA